MNPLWWFKTTTHLSAVTKIGPQISTANPICRDLAWVFRDPVAQLQVFPYFAAFVAVFFGFVWPVIDLSEGVFGVANYIRDYVECLRHGSDPLLCIPETAFSEKSANSPGRSPCCCFSSAIAVSEVATT